MLSPSEQQAILASLTRLALTDLAAIFPKLNLSDPKRLREPLAVVLAEISDKYGLAAAALAADWFEDARDAAGVGTRFAAVTDPGPDADRFTALAGWGIGPLFGADPDQAQALRLLGGGLQRTVSDYARNTIADSVSLDPTRPLYARHASANACAFCRMLATRGAAFASRESAERVVGRGMDATGQRSRKGRRAGGVRARGTQRIGDKYHDECHCVAVPVWPGQEYKPAPYVTEWMDQYGEAVDLSKGQYGAIDVKKTLANWRENTDAK